jgi:hypothetical protein
MPDFTITISDKVIARLQVLTAKTNEATGQNLTVKQYVITHLKNMVIGDEFAAAMEMLEAARDEQYQAALQAKRLELFAAYE